MVFVSGMLDMLTPAAADHHVQPDEPTANDAGSSSSDDADIDANECVDVNDNDQDDPLDQVHVLDEEGAQSITQESQENVQASSSTGGRGVSDRKKQKQRENTPARLRAPLSVPRMPRVPGQHADQRSSSSIWNFNTIWIGNVSIVQRMDHKVRNPDPCHDYLLNDVE